MAKANIRVTAESVTVNGEGNYQDTVMVTLKEVYIDDIVGEINHDDLLDALDINIIKDYVREAERE